MDSFKFIKTIDEMPPAIARQEVEKYFGGAIKAKTLANMDSKGEGPKGAFKIGRTVMYPTKSLAEFLDSRMTPLNW